MVRERSRRVPAATNGQELELDYAIHLHNVMQRARPHAHEEIKTLLRSIQQALQVDALRPLNWQAQRSIPHKLGQRSQPSAHTEGRGIV